MDLLVIIGISDENRLVKTKHGEAAFSFHAPQMKNKLIEQACEHAGEYVSFCVSKETRMCVCAGIAYVMGT